MKQNANILMIGAAVLVLAGVIFVIFRMTNGSGETAGYTPPPADADMKMKAQKMGEDYGKRMQQRYQGGGNMQGQPSR